MNRTAKINGKEYELTESMAMIRGFIGRVFVDGKIWNVMPADNM